MIKNFNDWEKNNQELNEFLGLGGLFKAFFKSLSEPVKKRVEILSKNIDSKTGNVKDSKQLFNDLSQTFKMIADDKKADLKGVDDIKTVKDILKEFLTEVKAVFSAARIPFASLTESEEIEIDEELLEKSKSQSKPTTIAELMVIDKPVQFESQLNSFLDMWIELKGGDRNKMADETYFKDLEKECVNLIDKMMAKFNAKIKEFGPERLQKLIELTVKTPNPDKKQIEEVLNNKSDDRNKQGERIKTDKGKQQILKGIEDSIKNGSEMLKIKNGDVHDIVIKNVKW